MDVDPADEGRVRDPDQDLADVVQDPDQGAVQDRGPDAVRDRGADPDRDPDQDAVRDRDEAQAPVQDAA